MKPTEALGSTISQYDTKYQKYKKAECLNNRTFEMSGYFLLSQRSIGMKAYKIQKQKLVIKIREECSKAAVGTFNTKLNS